MTGQQEKNKGYQEEHQLDAVVENSPKQQTRYINDPMSTSGAYDDWEKLGKEREGGKKKKIF